MTLKLHFKLSMLKDKGHINKNYFQERDINKKGLFNWKLF